MGVFVLTVIIIYFCTLFSISYITARKSSDNHAFFLGSRQSAWYIVAIGMIGASISGVTFVSVPGMVSQFDMTYMQMVLGFFPGYLIVAYFLLPLYYRLNLISIYGYLEQRFGKNTYKTGSSFFILSRMVGSASKLYLIILILQSLVFDQWGIPFFVTATAVIVAIWGYTFRSGMKTIIWTDALQTICVLLALILIIWQVSVKLDLNLMQMFTTVRTSEHARIFVFDDWVSKQNFFKQFISGVLIVIAMTGLDQDMMQKNLTCRNLKDAQKNMVTYGFSFIPLNLLFLSLGILLLVFAAQYNISLPPKSDEILPFLVTNYLGLPVLICFIIGIVAASFSNADSALTSLTTSVCVDLLGMKQETSKNTKAQRNSIHLLVCFCFLLVVLAINYMGQNNVLDTIYKLASYTYGPLLGLFFVGLFTRICLKDKLTPLVCLSALALSYALENFFQYCFSYRVGYEMLLLNALLTALGLFLIADRKRVKI